MGFEPKSPEFIPIKEYAAGRGWTRENVTDKIRRGIISAEATLVEPTRGTLIDPVRADLDIEFSGDDLQSLGNESSARVAPTVLIEGEMSRALVEEADERETTLDKLREKAHEYRDAKIDTEQLKARKLQLDIAERERELLPAEEVRRLVIKLVGETKDSLLNIPGRIAHVLHGLKDPLEVEAKLYQELNDALGNLSRLEKL